MSDSLDDGRILRVLNIIEEYSRGSLLNKREPKFSFRTIDTTHRWACRILWQTNIHKSR